MFCDIDRFPFVGECVLKSVRLGAGVHRSQSVTVAEEEDDDEDDDLDLALFLLRGRAELVATPGSPGTSSVAATSLDFVGEPALWAPDSGTMPSGTPIDSGILPSGTSSAAVTTLHFFGKPTL